MGGTRTSGSSRVDNTTLGSRYPIASVGNLPLARGAAWADLNDPQAREFYLQRAIRTGENIDTLLPREPFDEMVKMANDPDLLTTRDQTFFFGLDLSQEPVGEIRALGARSMTTDRSRAENYASGSYVFEAEVPAGSAVFSTEVFGIPETIALPGSRFEILGREGNLFRTRMISDGREYINELKAFRDRVDRASSKRA